MQKGFEAGFVPKLTDEGTSGTYLLRGPKGEDLAVFKPIDEEQFAPHNPRSYVSSFGSATFRAGVLSGEATIREHAAFLLDHGGFAGVPSTALAMIEHSSLLESSNTGRREADTISCSTFSTPSSFYLNRTG